MTDLSPCPKCGNVVSGHVNYYGLNKYRFYVKCSHCCLEWTSRQFNTAIKANNDGSLAWNGNCKRIKKKGSKHERNH